MKIMDNLIILEYKESKGQWHYNPVNNRRPKEEPDTYGWESIAYTEEEKASIFTYMMDCKLHRQEATKQPPYTAEYIRKEWKLFCYMFNSIIKSYKVTPEMKELVDKNFNDVEALARLGHGGFADEKEDKELPWAWEYDPLDFVDSNF